MTKMFSTSHATARPIWETSDGTHSFGTVVLRLLYGVMIIFSLGLGLTLVLGGSYLATLGGSWMYLLFGLGFLAAAVLFYKQRSAGVYILLFMALVSLVWGLIEADGNRWAMIPRLGIPFGFAAVGLILLPFLREVSLKMTALAAAVLVLTAVLATLIFVPDNTFENDSLMSEVNARTLSPVDADSLDRDWIAYGGTRGAVRYSSLASINPENVRDLDVAWTFNTGDMPEDPAHSKYGSEVTPLKVGNSIYICTPMNIIIALDPGTGVEKWRYDPGVSSNSIPYTAACRAVSYYKKSEALGPDGQSADFLQKEALATPRDTSADCAARIIGPTLDGRIIAVDAETGKPCSGFGTNGQIDMKIGMGEVKDGMVASTSPHTIINGVIVTNHQVKDNLDLNAPSGVIRGYSAETGELLWAWDMNASDMRSGPDDKGEYSRGTPNSWTISSGDPELGLVYVPLGNSAGDYVSYDRSDEELKYGTALVALDVFTGEPRWHFQTVKNDVWDYDLGSQASLVDFPTANGVVPALILPSKQGDIYVLDRRTGQSLFEVESRPVPQGGVEPWLRTETQPFSAYHTLAKDPLKPRDMWGMTMLDQLYCRIKFHQAVYDGIYTPPTAKTPWIQYPGYNGGSDWGGVAVDPKRGLIIANYNDMPNYNQLITKDQEIEGSGGGEMGPMEGATYGIQVNAGMRNTATQLLCKEPPYGGIRAIDMLTGETVWDRPLGTARGNGPWGIKSKLPFNIGTPNNGGSALTGSGLAFIGAATDDLVRAINVSTGETVWQSVLPGGGQAGPMTYEHEGRQYVVISAGGHHFMKTPISDAIVAYALPDDTKTP
ncbi:glucose dehydrogenase [Algimonas arctica]|uniref:Glucose dehydrogenase n=1 Tax=Algimonas arctica TaxID=1479486 RepID=A0A8J3CUR3_9PROT|nr:membrane-bound PQQ-dependent dehydrogenase, glucose/quinate/shikimate family [Algimonas arctica]GHB05056.1 glucose dehydrogenase [Algimonas arctica]